MDSLLLDRASAMRQPTLASGSLKPKSETRPAVHRMLGAFPLFLVNKLPSRTSEVVLRGKQWSIRPRRLRGRTGRRCAGKTADRRRPRYEALQPALLVGRKVRCHRVVSYSAGDS